MADMNSGGGWPGQSEKLCLLCGRFGGGHAYFCQLSAGYGAGLNNLTAEGANKMATSNPYASSVNVIEVVLITEDEEGDQQLAFGPKAFTATNANAAVAKATGEFVAGGGDASKVVNALTRFFG